MYSSNMWLIGHNEFEGFAFTGGKVVYIAEDVEPIYKNHPAIITAAALLPPVEAVQAEFDDRLMDAAMIYTQYLQGEEADPFISILVAAAIQKVPIGIMFGENEIDMQFPKVFIDFLYNFFGIVLGIQGSLPSYIEDVSLPFDMAKLYVMGIMDYVTFITTHPPLPIHPMAISKLVYENNPAVPVKDMQHYMEHFEQLRAAIRDNGGRFLIDPFEGVN